MFILPNLDLELGRMRANANTEAARSPRKPIEKLRLAAKHAGYDV